MQRSWQIATTMIFLAIAVAIIFYINGTAADRNAVFVSAPIEGRGTYDDHLRLDPAAQLPSLPPTRTPAPTSTVTPTYTPTITPTPWRQADNNDCDSNGDNPGTGSSPCNTPTPTPTPTPTLTPTKTPTPRASSAVGKAVIANSAGTGYTLGYLSADGDIIDETVDTDGFTIEGDGVANALGVPAASWAATATVTPAARPGITLAQLDIGDDVPVVDQWLKITQRAGEYALAADYLPASQGGLTHVISDASLTGQGTSAVPLSVARPVPDGGAEGDCLSLSSGNPAWAAVCGTYTFTAPLTETSGTVSITAASATRDGYMSAADKTSLDEVHGNAERRIFDVHYAGGNVSSLTTGYWIARLNGTKLASNTNLTTNNFNEIDIADIDSFYKGITDTNNADYNKQFIDPGTDQSEKYAQIKAGGNIRLITLEWSNGQWVSNAGMTARINDAEEITGGYRLTLDSIKIVGNINTGTDIKIGINPNFESVLWEDVHAKPGIMLLDGSNATGNTAITQTSEIPVKASSGDYENKTIGHISEHITPRTTSPFKIAATWEETYTQVTANSNKIGIINPLSNGVMQIVWGLSATPSLYSVSDTIPRADVVKYFNAQHHAEIVVGSAVIKGPIDSFFQTAGIWYINLGTDEADATQTPPPPWTGMDGTAGYVELDSDLISRAEFDAAVATIPEKGDLADITAGTDDSDYTTPKDVHDYTDGHATEENTVPFAAAFRETIARNFVLSVSADGQANISAGNSPPTAPDNTHTDALVVRRDKSDGTSEASVLGAIQPGDWLRAKRGSDYIITRIFKTEYKSTEEAYYYWFNPSTDVAETLQYDSLGTGAGEIRFYHQPQPSVFWLTSIAGTGNAITASAAGLDALEAGQMMIFQASAANTGAVTLDINSLGAKSLKSAANAALSSGAIASGTLYIAVYDGIAFRLMQ